jgi:nucleotide-binding universal stress UspA family protein
MSTQLDGAVVVGVDESIFKGWALRWAADQAHLEGRPLTLVNASGPVSSASREFGMDAVPGTSTSLRHRGEELLGRARAVVEQAAPAVEVGLLFEVTDPRTLLIKLSATAHLLVLGSRGRGPVRSHVLGSVGLAVVRHSGCPVVLHRPGGHPGLVHRGVLVAADATEESQPVLAFAFRMASLRGLPLRVVHYVYDVRSALVGTPMVGDLSDQKEEHARAFAESLGGFREDYPDVHIIVEQLLGLPEEDLVARSRQADLTVVGSHQRGVLGRLLEGSVSTSVVEKAHGPVAVVPLVSHT